MKRKNPPTKGSRALEKLIFYAALLAGWELLYLLFVQGLHLWKSYAIPSPVGVWLAFLKLVGNGTLIHSFASSMGRAGLGFLLSVVLGVWLGLLITASPCLNRNLKPLFLGIQTLPSICWVPFAILWFGLNEGTILFVVVMGSSFGIALSVENALHSVDPLYIKAARTMGASTRDLYLYVLLPACLPAFVSGLKHGWSFAWRALMSAEVMIAAVGLGFTLQMGRDLADMDQVMLVMLLIVIIGILIDRLVFSNIEQHLLKKRGLDHE